MCIVVMFLPTHLILCPIVRMSSQMPVCADSALCVTSLRTSERALIWTIGPTPTTIQCQMLLIHPTGICRNLKDMIHYNDCAILKCVGSHAGNVSWEKTVLCRKELLTFFANSDGRYFFNRMWSNNFPFCCQTVFLVCCVCYNLRAASICGICNLVLSRKKS